MNLHKDQLFVEEEHSLSFNKCQQILVLTLRVYLYLLHMFL